MDPFAVFALTIGMVIAASQQAAVMEQYAAAAGASRAPLAQAVLEPQPVAYVAPAPVVQPVPGWAAGAAVGAQVGALASAAHPVLRCGGRACGLGYDARPVIAGAVIGGLVGHAASAPAPVLYARAPEPAPATRRESRSVSSREFTEHWQQFMQPTVSPPRAAP